MIAMLQAELLRLRTVRSTWLAIGATALLAGLVAGHVLRQAGEWGRLDAGAGYLFIPAALIPAGIALIVGLLAVSGEFQHRTAETSLLACPQRSRWVLAKLGVHAGLGALLAVVAHTVVYGGAAVVLGTHGRDVVAARVASTALVGGLVTAPLLGALGVAIGAWTRHQVTAVLAALSLPVVPGWLFGWFPWSRAWSPFPDDAVLSLAGASRLGGQQLIGGLILLHRGAPGRSSALFGTPGRHLSGHTQSMKVPTAARNLDPTSRRLLDAGLAAAAAVALFVPVLITDPSRLSAAGWLLGIAATVPLAWRRRAPVTVLGVVAGAHAVWVLASLPDMAYAVLAVAVALYTVAGEAVRRPWVRMVGAGGSGSVAAALLVAEGLLMAGWAALLFAAGWLAGELVTARRAYVAELRDKARWLEASRQQELRLATAEERARIARELHDIVAHSMSLIAVRAGVGAHIAPRDPEEAAQALRVIEHVSREALDELRRMVGVLRDDGAGPREPPQSLDALPALCDRVSRCGTPVVMQVSGQPRPLPASLELNAYRIVQEALTNSLKHGNGLQVDVSVHFRDDALLLEILDQAASALPVGAQPTAGHGLLGITERAALFGGDIHAGLRPEGGFRVAARLPVAQTSGEHE